MAFLPSPRTEFLKRTARHEKIRGVAAHCRYLTQSLRSFGDCRLAPSVDRTHPGSIMKMSRPSSGRPQKCPVPFSLEVPRPRVFARVLGGIEHVESFGSGAAGEVERLGRWSAQRILEAAKMRRAEQAYGSPRLFHRGPLQTEQRKKTRRRFNAVTYVHTVPLRFTSRVKFAYSEP